MKWFSFVYAIAWITVACAVCCGIYVTKSANCLWALVFPLFINYKGSNRDENEKEINGEEIEEGEE